MVQTSTINSVQRNLLSRKKWRLLSIFFIITMIGAFSTACGIDSLEKSPIDDMSDGVYEQLVQHYFFAKKPLEIISGEADEEYTKGNSWVTEHELYENAVEYGEEHDVHPSEVFPNPLIVEYGEHPEQFSETEQIYIEMVLEFYDASNRVDLERVERLEDSLTEELKIKDSYDIFE